MSTTDTSSIELRESLERVEHQLPEATLFDDAADGEQGDRRDRGDAQARHDRRQRQRQLNPQ